MAEIAKKLLNRYKELILYGIFGLGATFINIIAYWLFFSIFHLYFMLANGLAWLLAFIFAFLTNKLFVFESKNFRGTVAVQEMISFLFTRVFTGVLDMTLMWLMVDMGKVSGVYAKIFVNVIVILVNYVMSKFWVFRKSKNI